MRFVWCLLLAMVCGLALAQNPDPITASMGITQNLGKKLPLDVPFKDEAGKDVTIGQYLQGRPLVIFPIFYKCETGCAVITHEFLQTLLTASHPTGLKALIDKSQTDSNGLKIGKDFDVLMVDIDPRETPDLAAAKKNTIMDSLGDPNADAHWHLLTGTLDNIHRVTDALGFKYYFNPTLDVIRHPTGSVIVSPDGTISSYSIGNDFPTKVLSAALEQAKQNQVGEPADESRMFGCIQIDKKTHKVTIVVENVVRLGCVLTLLTMIIGISLMIRSERKPKGEAPVGH